MVEFYSAIKKEELSLYNNMDELQNYYAVWNKQYSKEWKLYDSIYTKFSM